MADTTLEDLQQAPQKTADARLNVRVSANNPLKVGAHTVELVVVDNAGNASQPARLQIIVQDTTAPTAVLRVLDANGRLRSDNTVEFGQSFILSAEESRDSGPGTIESYTFQLLD